MSRFIVIIALIVLPLSAYAGMERDPLYPVNGHAPDPRKEMKLTVAPLTVDMSNDTSWQVYSPAACTFSNNTTPTNVGLQKPLSGGFWDGRVVRHIKHGKSFDNHSTAFLTFTNCTSGILERM